MQWMAIFPLLAIAVEARRIDEAVATAQLLFAPEQQRLPEELSNVLDLAIRSASSDGADFERAIDLAKHFKFL